jgi:formylglycine-generating enzyme required for sulfatase activity
MVATWSPPREIDEYRLVKVLGRGAMGTVWLAHDTHLDRAVAIKLISEPAPDGDARAQFFTEARAAARLHHPNVVTIHRVGEVDGRPYLVTEYLRGETLDRLPRPVDEALAGSLALGLARGLAAAHRRGVLHRDVKPANAILTEEGEVKLLDFGLARIDRQPVPDGEVAGTPAFLAPEVWAGEPPAPAADVYALGVALYQLVTGALPLRSPEAPRVHALRPGFPAGLAAVIDRCLARDPAERFASGEAVREALEIALAAARRPAIPEGNPYRSLLPFGPEHRALFFGRELEIADVIERLRAEPWVVVAGRSGAGKSSLVRAGIVPRVVDDAALAGDRPAWRAAAMVPAARPLAALVAACAPLVDEAEAELAAALRDDPAVLARALRADRAHATLLVVDQLEELVTLSEPAERDGFVEALGHMLALSPGLRVVATLRSDFVGHLDALGPLHRALGRALYVLGPLTPEGLTDAVVAPAAAHGVSFERPADVEALVAAVEGNPGSLPLLEFALAKLWDLRDEERRVIAGDALPRIGGVEGALARHADEVIAGLPAAETRRIFLRLVTAARTRARRPAEELGGGETLAALVRGRLLTTAEDGTVELAHEALIASWPRLAAWLDEERGAHQARERLDQAAAEWDRLGRPAEALWRGRRLDELALLEAGDLPPRERDFARASRRAERRQRWIRRALLVAAPTVIFGTVLGVQAWNQRRLAREAAVRVARAAELLAIAEASDRMVEALRVSSFSAYDSRRIASGLRIWRDSRTTAAATRALFDLVHQPLTEALSRAPDDPAARRLAAALHAIRFRIAERDGDEQLLSLHESEIRVYDDDGRYARMLEGGGTLAVDTDPPGATVHLAAFADVGDGRLELRSLGALGTTPIASRAIPMGTYVLAVSREGFAAVSYPVLVSRMEDERVTIPLIAPGRIPPGFRYVPAGPSIVGTREALRVENDGISPRHETRVPSFLIAQHEVTLGDWREYLTAEPAALARHLRSRFPLFQKRGDDLHFDLRALGLTGTLAPGEPYRYTAEERDTPGPSDWRRWPVFLVEAPAGDEYARWLDRTGRVPGARLCRAVEWERAARGADGRRYPHGEVLRPRDASFGTTYGPLFRHVRGHDEVGSFPASRSVFGVDDLVGNVWEWMRDEDGSGLRTLKSGAWSNVRDLEAEYQENATESYSRVITGLRICADLDPR